MFIFDWIISTELLFDKWYCFFGGQLCQNGDDKMF